MLLKKNIDNGNRFDMFELIKSQYLKGERSIYYDGGEYVTKQI